MRKHFIRFGIVAGMVCAMLLPSAAGAAYYYRPPAVRYAPAPRFIPRFQAPRVVRPMLRMKPGRPYAVAPRVVPRPGRMVYGRYG